MLNISLMSNSRDGDLGDEKVKEGISVPAMAALRVAATLTTAVPHLRARVRHGDDVVLELRHLRPDDAPRIADGARTMAPCAFRCAVGRAHRAQRDGARLAFLGLPPGWQPAVDIGTPPGGVSRPGGLYRVPLAERSVWAFATTLPAEAAHDAGRDLVDAAGPMPALHRLGLRPDTVTDVTLAYAETGAAPGSGEEDALIDLLESLLARYSTEELLLAVRSGSAATGSSRRRSGG